VNINITIPFYRCPAHHSNQVSVSKRRLFMLLHKNKKFNFIFICIGNIKHILIKLVSNNTYYKFLNKLIVLIPDEQFWFIC